VSTTAQRLELGQVITDWRGEAAILRRRGDERVAKVLEQCAQDVAAVSEEYVSFLTMPEACRRSGLSPEQMRRHARKFLGTPHATYDRRTGYMVRACIVPRRAHAELMREAAMRGAA
jgi:hypothetical protein